MSNSRVSNKQILDAILGLTEAIKAQVPAQAPATPVVATEKQPTAESTTEIEVGADYLANRKVAAQEHATAKGCEVVLYARRNLKGETKLAYALASRYDTLKDRGLIGPVATYQPE